MPWTNKLLHNKLLDRGEDAFIDINPVEITDPHVAKLWGEAQHLVLRLDPQLAAIRRLLLRPDVPISGSNDGYSNTALRAMIARESGIFYALVWHGILTNRINDPVVAVAWTKAHKLGVAYRAVYENVQAWLESD
jgi:hypothetical protein